MLFNIQYRLIVVEYKFLIFETGPMCDLRITQISNSAYYYQALLEPWEPKVSNFNFSSS